MAKTSKKSSKPTKTSKPAKTATVKVAAKPAETVVKAVAKPATKAVAKLAVVKPAVAKPAVKPAAKPIAAKPVAKKRVKKSVAKPVAKPVAKKPVAKKPATKLTPTVDLKAMAADVKGWLVEYFPTEKKLSDAALQSSINAKLKSSFQKIAAIKNAGKPISVKEVTARFIITLTQDEASLLRKRFDVPMRKAS